MNLTAEKLIEGQLNLPTLPLIVAKINTLVDDPEVGTREIGQAVSEDAPIAAQVLRIANSALYGLRAKVLSTEHATAILGVRQLRNIALQASVIKRFISATAVCRPSKTARETIAWPILSSTISGICAISATLP